MHAALGVDQRVQFIHDHGLHAAQQRAARLGGKEQIERFGRGDQDVRRVAQQGAAFGARRIPIAHGHADFLGRKPALGHARRDASQRTAQVGLDVVSQRLERGNVEHIGLFFQRAARGQARQAVDEPQKRGERLARARGRGDQRGFAARDGGPALRLHAGGLAHAAFKPLGRMRAEERERFIHGLSGGYRTSG